MRCLLRVIQAARDIDSPCAILNAEKAFDQLEWDYLWMGLELWICQIDTSALLQPLSCDFYRE